MQVIAVMNYKGGVGKTTMTANLGAEIASRGHKVLLIDLDPQANLTFSFYAVEEWRLGLRKDRTIMCWYEDGGVDLHSLILTPPIVNRRIADSGGRLDLIASHLRLIDIDLKLAARLGDATAADAEKRFLDLHGCLARALAAPAFQEYDVVLIDCAPNFGLVTKTAIVASDQVLVPARADYLSTLGVQYLIGHCDDLVSRYNDYAGYEAIRTRFLGVVFTMVKIYNNQPISTQRYYIEEVRLNSEIPVFNGTLRDSPRYFGDAGESGMPAVLRVPVTDDLAVEFRYLTSEILDAVGAAR